MKSFLALLFACGLACAAARAQTPQAPGRGQAAAGPELAEAERLSEQVAALYREGKFAEALEPARRVLELREKALGGEHLAVASALANLGTVYYELKKDGEAEPLLLRALAIGERLGEPGRVVVIEASNQLANIRFNDRDYKGSDAHLRRALALTVAARGGDDLAALPVLLNLTDLSYQRRQGEEAETYLARAVGILLRQPMGKEPDPVRAARLKRYVCYLNEESREGEFLAKLIKAMRRLDDPAEAARLEKLSVDAEAAMPGGVLNGRALTKVAPAYPDRAKQERISGKVVVYITVDEGGKVVSAEPLCGPPLITQAAVAAVGRWLFSPTLLNGQPVKVTGIVTVNFTLR